MLFATKTVDSCVAGLLKIVTDLEELVDVKDAQFVKNEEAIEVLQTSNEGLQAEMDKAVKIKGKILDLLS